MDWVGDSARLKESDTCLCDPGTIGDFCYPADHCLDPRPFGSGNPYFGSFVDWYHACSHDCCFSGKDTGIPKLEGKCAHLCVNKACNAEVRRDVCCITVQDDGTVVEGGKDSSQGSCGPGTRACTNNAKYCYDPAANEMVSVYRLPQYDPESPNRKINGKPYYFRQGGLDKKWCKGLDSLATHKEDGTEKTYCTPRLHYHLPTGSWGMCSAWNSNNLVANLKPKKSGQY